jgi:hypothetical protein
LREIAVFGSILRRFDQSFERLRPRGTASAACRGGNRIAGFRQNVLILAAGDRDALRMMRSQTTDFQKFSRGVLSRQHCCLITSSGTGKQNDKT